MTVTVTFTVDHASSPEHAEEVVRRYLERKGVTARGTVELTLYKVALIGGTTNLNEKRRKTGCAMH